MPKFGRGKIVLAQEKSIPSKRPSLRKNESVLGELGTEGWQETTERRFQRLGSNPVLIRAAMCLHPLAGQPFEEINGWSRLRIDGIYNRGVACRIQTNRRVK